MNSKPIDIPPVFVVSGGVGTSGEHLVRTVLAQFPAVDVPVIIVPYVRHTADLNDVIERAVATGGIIVHTLVDGELRNALNALAQQRGAFAVDLMGGLLDHLAEVMGQEPAGKPGLYRQQREVYFERMAAIEFAVRHDDGQRVEELPEAQIVIVGVSRVGKTPLSMYLSVQGWKVANVPLIPEVSPPPQLLQMDRRRVVGLVIEAGQLVAHRQWRRRNLGIPQDAPYADPTEIYEEVEWSRTFCRRHGFGIVDGTDKPIEASAEEVIALVTRRVKADEKEMERGPLLKQ